MKFQLKKVAAAVVMASFGMAASAATVTVGGAILTSPGNVGTLAASTVAVGIGDLPTNSALTAGVFYDDFTFSIAAPEQIGLQLNSAGFANITGLTAKIYSGANPLSTYSNTTNPFAGAALINGNTAPSSWAGLYTLMPVTTLGAGTYTLQFSGTLPAATPTFPGFPALPSAGAYGAAISVSAVPLPAAALLFGSGLTGLLGFARRPKKVA
jgi:hypothetical protein